MTTIMDDKNTNSMTPLELDPGEEDDEGKVQYNDAWRQRQRPRYQRYLKVTHCLVAGLINTGLALCTLSLFLMFHQLYLNRQSKHPPNLEDIGGAGEGDDGKLSSSWTSGGKYWRLMSPSCW